jgi:hypothetical protein
MPKRRAGTRLPGTNLIEAARELAAIMRRNTDNLDDALIVANKGKLSSNLYPVEGWMPAVIAVEKAIAEITGDDS